MKEMKYFIKSVLLIIICFSCSETNKDLKEIIIDPSKIELIYDMADDVEGQCDIIALETTDDCLITEITNIIYANNLYYIFDRGGQSVFMFDSNGKFVSKLHKVGGGPDEYSIISAFALAGKNIWIFDKNLRSLICYNEHLELIQRFDFHAMNIEDMAVIDGNLYLADNWISEFCQLAVMNTQQTIANESATVKGLIRTRAGVVDESTARFTKTNQLAVSGDSCLYIQSYCDTIFQAKDTLCEPKYKVTFTERYSDIPLPIEVYQKEMDGNSNIIRGIFCIRQSKNSIILTYLAGNELYSAFYSKKTEKSNVIRFFVNSNISSEIELVAPRMFFDESDYMTGFCESFELDFFREKDYDWMKIKDKTYREKLKSIMSETDEYSNPIIFRQKLKPDSAL